MHQSYQLCACEKSLAESLAFMKIKGWNDSGGKRFLGDENMSCHWTPPAQHTACHRWVPKSVQLNWTWASPEQVGPPPWVLTPKDIYEGPCLPAEMRGGLDTLKVSLD